MAAFKLVHVGVNADSPEEAVRTARMFEALFGLPVEEGSSSVFAGTAVEVMKPPYRGTHGHNGFGVSDVAAAKEELEAKGVVLTRPRQKPALTAPCGSFICGMKSAALPSIW